MIEIPIRSQRKMRLAIACVVFSLTFAVNFNFEATFFKLGAFETYNVLFHADPNIRLDVFANGWGDGRSIVHPNLANAINPPIRAVGWLFEQFSSRQQSAAQTRQQIALWVAPVFSGAAVVSIFLVGIALGLSNVTSVLIALMTTFSFSQLVFGSIPDHYVITGFLLSLGLLLFAWNGASKSKTRLVLWGLLLTSAGAVTITNVLPFFCIAAIDLGRRSNAMKSGIVVAALLSALSISGNYVARSLSLSILDQQSQDLSQTTAWTTHFIVQEPTRRVWESIRVLGSEFLGGEIGVRSQGDDQKSRDLQLTFEGADTFSAFGMARSLAALALVTSSVVVATKQTDEAFRYLAYACVSVIGFSLVLHLFWGSDYFLYSQHWHAAVIVLVALLVRFISVAVSRRSLYLVMGLSVVSLGLVNLSRMNQLFELLKPVG